MKKLIILDRDGVINQDSENFIKSPEEWLPVPGSLEAIARLTRMEYSVMVITNQSGIARRLFDIATLNFIHQKMVRMVHDKGGAIDGIFFCPHAAADLCDCRKPKPGLFRDLAHRTGHSLCAVPAVGDSLRDLQAAVEVGAFPVLVKTGKGRKTMKMLATDLSLQAVPDIPIYKDLSAFVDDLLDGGLEHELLDCEQRANENGL